MKTPFRPWQPSLLFGLALTVLAPPAAQADENPDNKGLGAFQSIQADQLEQLTGREGINVTNVHSIQHMKAEVSSNFTFAGGNIESGSVTIQAQSLDRYQGVGVFNILTGYNNAVDAAVGISIYMQE